MPTLKLRDQIHAKRVEIAKLETDITRCDASAATGDAHRQAVADLKRQRETIVAEAFIAGATADTKKIDKQIADADQAHQASIAMGVAAVNAKAILKTRVEAVTAELTGLYEQNDLAAAAGCEEAFSEAIKSYAKANDAVIGALVAMHSAATMMSSFDQRKSVHAIAVYDTLIRLLNESGLVSGPPNYSAPGLLVRGPDWNLSEPHVMRLVKSLDSLGIELPESLANVIEQETA